MTVYAGDPVIWRTRDSYLRRALLAMEIWRKCLFV